MQIGLAESLECVQRKYLRYIGNKRQRTTGDPSPSLSLYLLLRFKRVSTWNVWTKDDDALIFASCPLLHVQSGKRNYILS